MPKSLLDWRHAVAATLAVATIAGCSKPAPSSPPTPDMNPNQGVTVPVQPDLGNTVDKSTAVPLVAPPVALPPAPLAAPLVAPALGVTLGTPVPLIPFVSEINGRTKLFVFDRTIADNYALPGAGEDIQNPTLFSNSRIVFEREVSGHGYGKYGNSYKRGTGQIWFYDVVAELLVSFNDVNGLGSVRRPSISFDGTVMTFILESGKCDFAGKAMIWINGVVADLAKVNAVGALHDGVTWIRISCDARWATFTTGDGRLFVYDIVNPMVHEITDAQEVGYGYASHPAISPDGTQIAWADSSGFVFRYDRIADLIDPMPFLNSAFNAEFVTDPLWLCWDNAHIYAELFTYGPTQTGIAYPIRKKKRHYVKDFGFGDSSNALFEFEGSSYGGYHKKRDIYKVKVFPSVWRVIEYNWITETVAGLTILNNVLGEGVQLISDLDDDHNYNNHD